MNTDDFEKRLQRQTIRKVPATWRQEILDAAKTESVARPAAFNFQPTLWWRELFWPCRHAWTGMAALWLVMWGINSGLSSGEQHEFAVNSSEVPVIRRAMEERRQLLAELIPAANNQLAEPPRRNQPPPRSEARVEMSAA